ncbi:MAG TPA: hypothetical protein VIJ33_01345 [Solirubrobacteraceae bacterium]
MSDYQLDDELLTAVRAARPGIPQDVLSQTGPEAQAVLKRVMAANRRRRRVAAPSRRRPTSPAVTRTDPVPGLETSIDREAVATRPADRHQGLRKPNLGTVFAVMVAASSVAIAVLAIALLRHHQSPTPIRTTDAVPAVASATAKLRVGQPAGPQTANPNTFQGAAIPGTVKLVAETPDPHGGLPWGLREFQTTRGQTCLQKGRVRDGTIGVIGQDGAWANDGRFHPISPNAYTGDSCSETDRNGNAFNNVAVQRAIASADVQWGTGLQGDGCGGQNGRRAEPSCPEADLRDLDYGLLGPDAASITYVGAGGRLYTEPTNGPDGAYLIVGTGTTQSCSRQSGGDRACDSGSGQNAGPALQSGVITAVTYRNGHVCNLPTPTSDGTPQATCPPVRYAAPRVQHVTAAQVAAPVTVQKLPAKHYCTSGPLTFAPCKAGQTPLKGEQGVLLINIRFTARVAVTNGNSYYQFSDRYPSAGRQGCSGSGTSGTTLANIRAGQRVLFQDQIPDRCTGVVHGTISYVPASGAAGYGSGPTLTSGHDGSLPVGNFSLRIP